MSSSSSYNLSDRQFRIAVWLYENRPFFNQAVLCIVFGTALVFFLLSLIYGSGIAFQYNKRRLYFLRVTQNSIIYEDPSLDFAPQPLQLKAIRVVPHMGRGTDFLIEIHNPNQKWAALEFDYVVYLNNTALPTRHSFALPGTNYYGAFMPHEALVGEASVEVNVVRWLKINSFLAQERLSIAYQFPVTLVQFIPGDKKEVVDSITAVIENKTPFSFWNGSVLAWVTKQGKILAVGETTLAKFAIGEQREVVIGMGILPSPTVDDIKIITQVNVLDERNVM